MPTRRIGNVGGPLPWPDGPCIDRDHLPPTMIVWPTGVYEHTCPTCNFKTRFTVQSPTFDSTAQPVTFGSSNRLPDGTWRPTYERGGQEPADSGDRHAAGCWCWHCAPEVY